jgi:hypothetical protein
MVYGTATGESSHFYGQGTPDPLREDVTLQSLEAKSVRFMSLAHTQKCAVVNLSELAESRLLFPRVDRLDLAAPELQQQLLRQQSELLNPAAAAHALQAEQDLGYMVASGRYWEHTAEFDKTKLSDIDSMWLQAITAAPALCIEAAPSR